MAFLLGNGSAQYITTQPFFYAGFIKALGVLLGGVFFVSGKTTVDRRVVGCRELERKEGGEDAGDERPRQVTTTIRAENQCGSCANQNRSGCPGPGAELRR